MEDNSKKKIDLSEFEKLKLEIDEVNGLKGGNLEAAACKYGGGTVCMCTMDDCHD